jgi:hypothetical protein
MGAASIKGLVLMETVFPSPDGYTVFDDPQMKKQLVKELKKGTIKPPAASDELDIDEDLESKIDQVRFCPSFVVVVVIILFQLQMNDSNR